MSTLTSYSKTSDGYVQSYNTNASTASQGSNLSVNDYSDSYLSVGPKTSMGNYYFYEGFVQFDTSSLTSNAQVSSVTLTLFVYHDFTWNYTFTERIMAYDWGTTLDTSDFQPRWTTLRDATILSELAMSAALTQWTAGTSHTHPSTTNFINAVNKTGDTRLLLYADVHANASFIPPEYPNSNQYMMWYPADSAGTTYDPKMVVTYTTIIPNKFFLFF